MKHHYIVGSSLFSIIVLFCVLNFYATVLAQTNLTEASVVKPKQVAFGGKVIARKIGGITCDGATEGTAPVVLSSNLAGAGQAALGAASKNQSGLSRVAVAGNGLYKAIPLYTLRYSADGGKRLLQPKVGEWVLGMHDLTPDFTVCDIKIFDASIPFPVVRTNNYGVSQ